jgi:hypothetical protein
MKKTVQNQGSNPCPVRHFKTLSLALSTIYDTTADIQLQPHIYAPAQRSTGTKEQ